MCRPHLQLKFPSTLSPLPCSLAAEGRGAEEMLEPSSCLMDTCHLPTGPILLDRQQSLSRTHTGTQGHAKSNQSGI